MTDKLINCDCMDFMKTLPDSSVDLTLTDIPYDGINKTGTERSIKNLNKGKADVLTFNINSFLKEVDRITKGAVIIFCGITQVSEIFSYFKDKGYPTRQLIWEKTNPSPMNGQFMYLSATENAVWSKRGGLTLMLIVSPMFFTFLWEVVPFTRQKKITTFCEN